MRTWMMVVALGGLAACETDEDLEAWRLGQSELAWEEEARGAAGAAVDCNCFPGAADVNSGLKQVIQGPDGKPQVCEIWFTCATQHICDSWLGTPLPYDPALIGVLGRWEQDLRNCVGVPGDGDGDGDGDADADGEDDGDAVGGA